MGGGKNREKNPKMQQIKYITFQIIINTMEKINTSKTGITEGGEMAIQHRLGDQGSILGYGALSPKALSDLVYVARLSK